MIRRLYLRWLCFKQFVCYTHAIEKEWSGGFVCPRCEEDWRHQNQLKQTRLIRRLRNI